MSNKRNQNTYDLQKLDPANVDRLDLVAGAVVEAAVADTRYNTEAENSHQGLTGAAAGIQPLPVPQKRPSAQQFRHFLDNHNIACKAPNC